MHQETFEDFRFISSEAKRFQAMGKDLLKCPDEAMYHLRPTNGHIIIIGKAANQSFIKILNRVLNIEKELSIRAEKDEFFSAIRDSYTNVFIGSTKELTFSDSGLIIQNALESVRNSLTTKILYVPCFLPLDKNSPEFKIGPIRFIQMENFLHDKERKFEDYIHKENLNGVEHQEGKDKEFSIYMVDNLKKIYRDFPWVAEVKVEKFSKKMAPRIAERGVNIALNILRVIFPLSHAERIQIFNRPRWQWEGAYYRENQEGVAEIGSDRRFKFHSEDGWVEKILHDQNYIPFLAGSLIPFFLSSNEVPLLYQRYINALWWFGEAVYVDLPYLKVTALANCLESFLRTTDKGITKQISNRASLLMKLEDDQKNWEVEIKRFYKMRSDLVHGRIAPFDPKVDNQANIGLQVAQNMLRNGLAWTHYLSYKPECLNSLGAIEALYQRDFKNFCDGTLPGIE